MSDRHVHPAALFGHQPAVPGGSSHAAAQAGWEIRDILVRQSHREPRSVQRDPGPSELGVICDRQVVAKMAGEAETGHTADPWPSIVGLALDAWLKQYFRNENRLNGFDRWLTDIKVRPHPLYPGTLDLYDTVTYTVLDLKAQGASTAAKLRSGGPSPRYFNQVRLYAWGMRLAGYRVDRVSIVSLPRTKSFLSEIYVWDHVLTEADDLAVIELLQRTEARRHAAQLVTSGQLPIGQVQRTPDGEECHFCDYFRVEAAHDGGPGCPGDRAPVTYPYPRAAPAA